MSFLFVGTTRGQGTIRVVVFLVAVATFFRQTHFLASILTSGTRISIVSNILNQMSFQNRMYKNENELFLSVTNLPVHLRSFKKVAFEYFFPYLKQGRRCWLGVDSIHVLIRRSRLRTSFK